MILTESNAISETLKNADNLFQHKYPIFIKVAHRHGMLESVALQLNQIYFESRHITDPKIIESLLVVALYHCDDSYCYVTHSMNLLGMGFSVEDVQNITEAMEVPADIPDKTKWDSVVRATFFAFKGDHFNIPSLSQVAGVLIPEEYDEYVKIMGLAHTLKHILASYEGEMDVVADVKSAKSDADRLKAAEELVRYYLETKPNDRSPVVSICMFCKDVKKSEDQWVPIESAVKDLHRDSLFSHGICPRCMEQQVGSKTPEE